jgi:hypothetical protein
MQKKVSVTCILFLLTYHSIGQVSLESSPAGGTRDGALVVYGSDNINNNKRVPYEKISGSPFWKSEYQLATIIDVKNQVLGKAPSKLNLYTNELYFISPKGEERVAAPGTVRKVVFYKGVDTTSEIAAVFENNLPLIVENNPNAENPSYVQILNNGDVQLLKHLKKMFVTADSLFGTMKRYYFSDQVSYYINSKYGQNIRLRKLSRENVLETLRIVAADEAWIKKNAINFKKEEDVIRFLNYYNNREKG